jgi:hypothetical protein
MKTIQLINTSILLKYVRFLLVFYTARSPQTADMGQITEF